MGAVVSQHLAVLKCAQTCQVWARDINPAVCALLSIALGSCGGRLNDMSTN